MAVDLFFFRFGFEEDQADTPGVGGPGEVGAERGGDAASAEWGQDPDGGEFAGRGPVAGGLADGDPSRRARVSLVTGVAVMTGVRRSMVRPAAASAAR